MGALSTLYAQPTPVGTIISAPAAPSSDWLEMSGQAVSKTAYPTLATIMASDPYRLEASSFFTVVSNLTGGFQSYIGAPYARNQLGYANGKYWAVSSQGVVAYSTNNATSWSTATVAAGAFINGIIFCPSTSKYIAYGCMAANNAGVQVWTSSDLITWTNKYNQGSSTESCAVMDIDSSVNPSNPTIVGVCDSGTTTTTNWLIYSTDGGTTWSRGSGGMSPVNTRSFFAPNIKFFKDFGKFFIVCRTNAPYNYIYSTTDGVSVQSRLGLAGSTYGEAADIVQMNSRLVVLARTDSTASNYTTRYSTDTSGNSWSYDTFGSNTSSGSQLCGAAKVGDQYLLGFGTYIVKTRDGKAFSSVTSPANPSFAGSLNAPVADSMPYAYNGYVIGTNGMNTTISYDGGNSWLTFGRDGPFNQMLFNDGVVLAVNGSNLMQAIPSYNTTNYFWLPNRVVNGTKQFIKAR